ncbi:MAG: hypothetical protein C3F14_09535, partial [Deltaproteobacteria bacterium]
MSESARGALGGAAVLALLVSMAVSRQILEQRPLSDVGGEMQSRLGLIAAVSERPDFSFGFRNVFADMVWLEAVQVAGNARMPLREYDRLYHLLT